MAENKPSKDLLKVKECMGEHWRICRVDWELCLYREFSNGVSIEVSGLNNSKKYKEVNVYVWCFSNSKDCRPMTIVIYNRIRTFELLKSILNLIVAEWSCKNANEVEKYHSILYTSNHIADMEHHYMSPLSIHPKKFPFPTFFSETRQGTDFEFDFFKGYCYK